MLEEGWYLMDTRSLERELIRWRTGDGPEGQEIVALSSDEALDFRNAGNVPDELGRTLRLVLRVDTEADLRDLDSKRLRYEPDYLDPPTWRRAGSKPVNVVPLRPPDVAGSPKPWWEDEAMARLESEWQATGRVAGIAVPAEYRSFVYKTVVALQRVEREVTVDSVAGAIERWVSPEQADEIRTALRRAEPPVSY
jgi:hypothetical protein